MTSASLQFGKSRQLLISMDAPSGLHRGAGLHRLTFPLVVDSRNTIAKGVPVSLRGDVWIGSGHEYWLGTWHTANTVITRENPDRQQAVLPLTDEQLAVLEQRRAGTDLQFQLQIEAVLGYDPDVAGLGPDERWPCDSGEAYVHIQSSPWERLLAQVKAGTSLAIVVPIALSDSLPAAVGGQLREAIQKINSGDYGDAVTAARKAIDILDEALHIRAPQDIKAILEIKKDQRTADQRLAFLSEALHCLASPAAHGDSNAREISWNRENALAVVAGITALAATVMPQSL